MAVEEHLTQVGGPGALLGTDLEKLQSQASPLNHPQEVAEAAGSSLVEAGFKLKALGSLIACNHLV